MRALRAIGEMRRRLRAEVEETSRDRARLGRAAGRVRAELRTAEPAEARQLRPKHARLRQTIRALSKRLGHLEQQVASTDRRLGELRGRVRPFPVVLSVVESHGELVVEDVTAPEMLTSLTRIDGYSEDPAGVDAWGADYFGARFGRPDPDGPVVRVTVRSFWTGPLRAPYEERCRAEVRGRGGVVWTEPERDARYESAPPREQRRDARRHVYAFDYAGDVDELALRMLCEWRPQ